VSLATSIALAGLAGRLTDSEDRERYTAILLYLQTLPLEDEFRHLAEIMGLLSLLGQRVPDALAGAMTELRELTDAAGNYHAQVDKRLASLPDEIAAGVDVEAMAEGMAESFRQQIAATGLQTTAALLRSASKEITALSGQISATLKPAAQEYKNVSATISSELGRLTLASDELRRRNTQLVAQEQTNNWWMQCFLMLAILLAGIIAGVYVEKGQTTEALVNLGTQVERIQTPAAVSVPVVAPAAKKSRK
jgi:hypothetical protein